MTKQQALDIIKLISALEIWTLSVHKEGILVPDFLYERIDAAIEVLTKEVLG